MKNILGIPKNFMDVDIQGRITAKSNFQLRVRGNECILLVLAYHNMYNL